MARTKSEIEHDGEAEIFQALTKFITDTVSSITWTNSEEEKVKEKIEELYNLQVQIHSKAQQIRELISPQSNADSPQELAQEAVIECGEAEPLGEDEPQ